MRGVQIRGDTGKERAEKHQEKCQDGLREETARGGAANHISAQQHCQVHLDLD